MKKPHFRLQILQHIIITMIGFFLIFTGGFKTNFGFIDQNTQTLDIYPTHDTKIISINYELANGNPVRLISDKVYDSVHLEYQNEIFEFNEGFTFIEIESGSFEIKPNINEVNFALKRTFH